MFFWYSPYPPEHHRTLSRSCPLGLFVFLLTLILVLPALGQSDAGALKRQAESHIEAGRYGEAIALLDKYIADRPSDADAYRLRGVCYQGRGQLESAVEDFRKAASLDPSNSQIRGLLSAAENAWRERVSIKIEGYKRDLARNASASTPYLQIAQAYKSIEAWTDAEQWYDEYFKRTGGNPDEILQFSEVLARLNHLQKGESLLERAVEKYPHQAELSSRWGYFLLWLGKYRSSEKAFEKALALQPSFAEAQEGLDQARTAERAPHRASVTAPRAEPSNETPIDHSMRLLKSNPADEEARFSLVQELINVNRFDEALHHLDTLSFKGADSLRIQDARTLIMMRRDTLYRSEINDYLGALKGEPTNTRFLLQIARRYGELGEYKNALTYLDRILANASDTSAADVRFRYAQYAAWGRYFDSALTQLNLLQRASPGNLDYQLLRGQIAVWSQKDINSGVRVLSNVVRIEPTNLSGLAALSSALALEGNFTTARDYLERARKIDENAQEVKAAQRFYDDAVRADEERKTYAILESARDLASSGDCQRAVKKYDEYLARVPAPGKTVLLAYADAQSCAKNQRKAIQICDRILEQGYDYDVALTRAKYVLWSGDSLQALQDFGKLRAEKPEDFEANLFLGESYQRLRRYPEAREVYQRLLDQTTADDRRSEVLAQMRYLPLTGISGAFTTFPTRLAISPPVSYYSDNQEFSLASYGGRLELGVASMLSLGGSYSRTLLQSGISNRYFNEYKGQVFIRFSDRFSLSGGYGTLQSRGRLPKRIGDAALVYERPGTIRVEAVFEANDAALLLYSPYLIDLPYDARLYRVRGSSTTTSGWELSGSYRILAISDGNKGTDLQIRVGHLFFNDVGAGYEYLYSDYLHEAPWIPFTNHAKQLYYTPQNQESHALWLTWEAEKDQEVTFNLGGKIGYLPAFRTAVREVNGDLTYKAAAHLLLNGKFSIGDTYRTDGGYNYVSMLVSLYWSVL